MSKKLLCKPVNTGRRTTIIAYALEPSARTPEGTNFVLWESCNEHSPEAHAVMKAARKLSEPSDANKQAAVEALTTYTGVNNTQAVNLVQAIVDGVEAVQQHSRDKQ